MRYAFVLITIIVLFSSCNQKKSGEQSQAQSADTLRYDSIVVSDTLIYSENDRKDIERISSPVDGYKPLEVTGRWRSKDNIDTLSVHLYSRTLGKEMASPSFFRDEFDYDRLAELMIKLNPVVYVVNRNNPADTLTIGEGTGQMFGLYFIINEGDLDGDGLDELIYMVDWADWSATNTFHIATYKNGKWADLYNFPVWEWQFDEGYENVLQKLPGNKIMINFRNDEAEAGSKIVDLGTIAKQLSPDSTR